MENIEFNQISKKDSGKWINPEEKSFDEQKQELLDLMDKDFYKAIDFINENSINKDILSLSEIQGKAEEIMLKVQGVGMIIVKDNFYFSNEFLSSDLFFNHLNSQFYKNCESDKGSTVPLTIEFLNKLNFQEELNDKVKKNLVFEAIRNGKNHFARDYAKAFDFDDSIFISKDAKNAAKKSIRSRFIYSPKDALRTKEFTDLSDEEYQDTLKDLLIDVMESTSYSINSSDFSKFPDNIIESEEVKISAYKYIQNILTKRSFHYIETINETLGKFNIAKEDILALPEIQEILKNNILFFIEKKESHKGSFADILKQQNNLSLSMEVIEQRDMQNALNSLLDWSFSASNNALISYAEAYIKVFNISDEIVQEKLGKYIFNYLSEDINSDLYEYNQKEKIKKIIKYFSNENDVRKGILKGFFVQYIKDKNIAQKIKQDFNISFDNYEESELQEIKHEALKDGLIKELVSGDVSMSIKIKHEAGFSQDFLLSSGIQELSLKRISTEIINGNISNIIKIKNEFYIPNAHIKEQFIILLEEDSNISKIKNSEETKEYFIKYILGESWTYNEQISLAENILIKKKLLLESGGDINDILEFTGEPSLVGNDDYKDLFESIRTMEGSVWSDGDHEISNVFEKGGEYFGYRKMFEYVGAKDRHDKLFAFDKILLMAEQSELEPAQFFNNILGHVSKDSSDYDGLKSYQKLNNIAELILKTEISEVLESAERYKGIKKLQDLVENIGESKNLFASWKNLKKFADLVDLLDKVEILDELQDLDQEGKPELKNYIETLAFHPNINTKSVIEFWKNPGGVFRCWRCSLWSFP